MATMYYIRDGAPPNNITHTKEISLNFIKEHFEDVKKKFLSSLSNEPPVFNASEGAANQYSAPRYVVLKIFEKEIEFSEFDRSGFYVLENVSPKLT